ELTPDVRRDAFRDGGNRTAATLELFDQARRDGAGAEIVMKMPNERRLGRSRTGAEQVHLEPVRMHHVWLELGDFAAELTNVRQARKAAADGAAHELGPR